MGGLFGGKPSMPEPAAPKPAPPPAAETASSLKIPKEQRAKEEKAKTGGQSLRIKRDVGGTSGGTGLNI